MTLLEKLQANLSLPANFSHMSDNELQRILAPQLRKFAVSYLGNPLIKTPVTVGFRGEYLPKNLGEHYKTYLKRQSNNGVWGSYIEATALGEALNCNVFVMPMTKNEAQQSPICLYYAGDSAPIVNLYNHNNQHWSVDKCPTSTTGDGNCLYNAFAQSLRNSVIAQECYTSSLTFYKKQTPQFKRLQIETIKSQERALAAMKANSYLNPQKSIIQLEKERERISVLPQEEQEQIAKDYVYALELAQEDYAYMKSNLLDFRASIPDEQNSSSMKIN